MLMAQTLADLHRLRQSGCCALHSCLVLRVLFTGVPAQNLLPACGKAPPQPDTLTVTRRIYGRSGALIVQPHEPAADHRIWVLTLASISQARSHGHLPAGSLGNPRHQRRSGRVKALVPAALLQVPRVMKGSWSLGLQVACQWLCLQAPPLRAMPLESLSLQALPLPLRPGAASRRYACDLGKEALRLSRPRHIVLLPGGPEVVVAEILVSQQCLSLIL
mmetsp:Transcript_117393/g.207556  ORF Transcript_117393/g.207556 Transcript_117393/m.207556 type:complete len:219 (+) Transcript_117393:130-786(+)